MPNIYSKNHDHFINNCINNNGENKCFQKEKFVFGKHKTNYIFPVYLMVKVKRSSKGDKVKSRFSH